MCESIDNIQRQFIAQYGFKENPEKPGVLMDVSDGTYPMVVGGRLGNVLIKEGRVFCFIFEGLPL